MVQPRVHAGAPTGGQFSAGAHAESTAVLERPWDSVAAGPMPVPIVDLQVPDEGALVIDESELGTDTYSQIEVLRYGDEYWVTGTVLPELRQVCPELDDAGAEHYLDAHANAIELYAVSEYGAVVNGERGDWVGAGIEFEADLDITTDTSATLLDRLHRDTNAEQLHNELDGSNGPVLFHRKLRDHLDQLDAC